MDETPLEALRNDPGGASPDNVRAVVVEHDYLVEGLRELHQPRFVPGVAGQTNDITYCRECSRTWPCPTMQLVGVE